MSDKYIIRCYPTQRDTVRVYMHAENMCTVAVASGSAQQTIHPSGSTCYVLHVGLPSSPAATAARPAAPSGCMTAAKCLACRFAGSIAAHRRQTKKNNIPKNRSKDGQAMLPAAAYPCPHNKHLSAERSERQRERIPVTPAAPQRHRLLFHCRICCSMQCL